MVCGKKKKKKKNTAMRQRIETETVENEVLCLLLHEFLDIYNERYILEVGCLESFSYMVCCTWISEFETLGDSNFATFLTRAFKVTRAKRMRGD